MEDKEHLRMKTCPICKKKFLPAVFHRYKVNGRQVCSYPCSLKGDKGVKRYKTYGAKSERSKKG